MQVTRHIMSTNKGFGESAALKFYLPRVARASTATQYFGRCQNSGTPNMMLFSLVCLQTNLKSIKACPHKTRTHLHHQGTYGRPGMDCRKPATLIRLTLRVCPFARCTSVKMSCSLGGSMASLRGSEDPTGFARSTPKVTIPTHPKTVAFYSNHT